MSDAAPEADLSGLSADQLRILDSVPGFVWITAPDGAATFFNRAWRDFTGCKIEEQAGLAWFESIHPQDRERLAASLEGAEAAFRLEIRVKRKDGNFCWILLCAAPIVGKPDEPGWVCNGLDIHDAKAWTAEVDHRVKNSFVAIRSLVSLTARGAQTKEAFAEALEGRIEAYLRAQNFLAQTKGRNVTLRQVIDETLSAVDVGDSSNFSIEGPDLPLTPAATVSLTLVAHELATNAARHGALSVPSGHLNVSWQRNEREKMLMFRWEERGGPKPIPPKSPGFGLRLMRQVVITDLNGSIGTDYSEPGFRMSAQLPLNRVSAANKAEPEPD